jgi:hypothetical protein
MIYPFCFQITSLYLSYLYLKTLKGFDFINTLAVLFEMNENSWKCIFIKFSVI